MKDFTDQILYNKNHNDAILSYLNIEITNKKFKCVNPDHNDHNPSMGVFKKDDTPYLYKCFACKQTYNILQILQIKQNLPTFMDSLISACKILNLELPTNTQSYTNINITASKILQSILSYQKNIDISNKVVYRKINSNRRIPKHIIEQFHGIFLNKKELNEFLTDEELNVFVQEFYHANQDNAMKDLQYRLDYIFADDSALFPFYDLDGLLCGAILYAPESDRKAKYITLRKQRDDGKNYECYFNENNAINHAKLEKSIYLCEGVIDCMSMVRAGKPNSMALLGVDVDHAKFLTIVENYDIQKIYLALDVDERGFKKTNVIINDFKNKKDIYVFQPNPVNSTSIIKDIDEYINLSPIDYINPDDLVNYINQAFEHFSLLYIKSEIKNKNAMINNQAMKPILEDFINNIAQTVPSETDAFMIINSINNYIKHAYDVPYTLDQLKNLYLKKSQPILDQSKNAVSDALFKQLKTVQRSTTTMDLENGLKNMGAIINKTVNKISSSYDSSSVLKKLNQLTEDFYINKLNSENRFYTFTNDFFREAFKDVPKKAGYVITISAEPQTAKSMDSYNLAADIIINNPDTTVILLILDDSRETADNKYAPVMYNNIYPKLRYPTSKYKDNKSIAFKNISKCIIDLERSKKLYVIDGFVLDNVFKLNKTVEDIFYNFISDGILKNKNSTLENVVVVVDAVSNLSDLNGLDYGSNAWEHLKSWFVSNNALGIFVAETTKVSSDNMIISAKSVKGSNKSEFKSDTMLTMRSTVKDPNVLNQFTNRGVAVKFESNVVVHNETVVDHEHVVICNLTKHKANPECCGVYIKNLSTTFGTIKLTPHKYSTEIKNVMYDTIRNG